VNAASVAVDSLDGLRLNFALQAGIVRLLARQEHLDKINVFPVPDGDTGTNLALTAHAVLGVLRKSRIGTPGRHSHASPTPHSTVRVATPARSSRSSSSVSATGSGTCASSSPPTSRRGSVAAPSTRATA
jgi:hypothetical protein